MLDPLNVSNRFANDTYLTSSLDLTLKVNPFGMTGMSGLPNFRPQKRESLDFVLRSKDKDSKLPKINNN